MLTLPAALAALGRYRQFIVYKTVPSTRKPGKTDKLPVDWRTGQMPIKGSGGAHDPEIWLDFDTAAAQALRWGMHVGFVLTKNDPFWFVDVDGALQPDGTWNAIAQQFAQVLAGAAVEISGSGKGLHFIGSGPVPEHGTKNSALGIECYDSLRFIALTGINAAGSAEWRSDERIAWIAQTYFPPVAPGAEVGDELTDAPRSDWKGPEHDHDLIRRASAARSAGAVFGDRATFADLWLGDRDKLAKAFPSSSGDDYDRSSADAALAAHLAFWTGCHGTRIERLMRASALQREKWDHHATYLNLTIRNACARQTAVCQDKPISEQLLAAPAVPDPAPRTIAQDLGSIISEGTPKGRLRDTNATFLDMTAQMKLFEGCVWVEDESAVFYRGSYLKPDQFRVRFGGYAFAMDNANEKVSTDPWEAFWKSQIIEHPRVDTTCFKPRLPLNMIAEIEGRRTLNCYWPIDVPQRQGNVDPFINHLNKLLPDARDRKILLNYLAACVQRKGYKFQWAPLIQGVEGNGKSFFSTCVINAIGERYAHIPRADQISAKFNSWIKNKLIIAVEDVFVPDHKVDLFEILKPMITQKRQPIEPKGVDQRMIDACFNMILNSNHQDGLRKTKNDRRICPLFCAQQSREDLTRDGLNYEYFQSLQGWYENGGMLAVNYFLNHFEIEAEFDPSTGQIAPTTTSTEIAIQASLGLVEQTVLEAIEQQMQGFRGDFVSSTWLDRLLKAEGLDRRVPPNKRRALMASLGYDFAPCMPTGRTHKIVMPDASRPLIYVSVGSESWRIKTQLELERAYSASQS